MSIFDNLEPTADDFAAADMWARTLSDYPCGVAESNYKFTPPTPGEPTAEDYTNAEEWAQSLRDLP